MARARSGSIIIGTGAQGYQGFQGISYYIEVVAGLVKNDLLTEKVFFEGGIRFGEDGGGDFRFN
ncbi:MAG: hypothetical protein GX896_08505 [Clostridiales bacterium]|nr:hypothetical protein [Clostridiales bacterium]